MPPATPKLDAAALQRAVDRLLRLDEEVQAALDETVPGFLDKLRAELPKLVRRAARDQSEELAGRMQALEVRLEQQLAAQQTVAPAQVPVPASNPQTMAGTATDVFVTPAGLRYALDRQAARLRTE